MTAPVCAHTLTPAGDVLTCAVCQADFPHRKDCPEPGGQHCLTLCTLAPALASLATCLDLPPELLPEPSATEHTRRQAQEAAITVELEEALHGICQRITDSVLHPTLRDEGVPDWQQYRITFDTSALTEREGT